MGISNNYHSNNLGYCFGCESWITKVGCKCPPLTKWERLVYNIENAYYEGLDRIGKAWHILRHGTIG